MSGPSHPGYPPQTPPDYSPQFVPPQYAPSGYRPSTPPKKSGTLVIIFWVVGALVLLILALIVVGIGAFVYVRNKPYEARWIRAKSDMSEISKGLNEYHIEQNAYPESLTALQNYFGGNLPTDPFTKRPYDYVRTPTGFRLTCLGKDLAPGGAEIPDRDIVYDERGLYGGP